MSERNEVLERLARTFAERGAEVDAVADTVGEPERGQLRAQASTFAEARATALRLRT